MKHIYILAIISIAIAGCVGNSDQKSETKENPKQKIQQLNISIFLDLSNRIDPQKNPNAVSNDIENIKTITEYFKANMENLGAYRAKGKIGLYFDPTPNDQNINATVRKLKFDCSRIDNKQKKQVYDSITSTYSTNLVEIYKRTITTGNWIGSDIWRFFKDNVKDLCIEKDSSYRNIIIILTDGYLYHQQTVIANKNRFSYILSNNIKPYRAQNYEQLINQNNFGLITARTDLQNLEVLVLELKTDNPQNKIDEDIMKYVWKNWFKEMNVSHFEVFSSDLPINTKTKIEMFLNADFN